MTTADTTARTTRIERRAFVRDLLSEIPDAIVVTGLGSPSYDVYAAGARDLNFHLWGAMGAAVPVGLGVALAQPERSVVVITGDGEHLMGIGALGTVTAAKPENLTIVVLDNGHFGETGMQQSHASLGTNLTAVADGFGIGHCELVERHDQVQTISARANARRGTAFFQVRIETNEPPRALPPRDGAWNKNSFRAALGFETF